MKRREFLSVLAAASVASPPAGGATPESGDLERLDLVLDGDAKIARRSLVLVPKHVPAGSKLPLLVLLHGLGETGNEELGIRAWADLYGLVRAYERLRRPPVERTLKRHKYLTDARARELDEQLRRQPLRGLVFACPVTPNPSRLGPAPRILDSYADWIENALLPAVRQKAPVLSGPENTGLDGCSLGGYVGAEVFVRKPELFGSFGGVQSAFGVGSAARYAERIARAIEIAGPRPIHVETSTEDPFRRANELLSKRLSALGVPNELVVPPGPHNQPWLKEVGSLEMLLWHDRQLGRGLR